MANPESNGEGLSADALQSYSVAADESGDFAAAGGASLDHDCGGDDNHDSSPRPLVLEPSSPLDSNSNRNNVLTDDNLENRPPQPPLDVISATHDNENDNDNDHNTIGSSHHVRQASSVQTHLEDPDTDLPLTLTPSLIMEGDGMDDMTNLVGSTPPPRSFVPGPLREEPTLKEKLVDRERQRRKEAERARLKRQFALMSNGGAMIFDNATGTASSTTGAVRENGSIAGTVGEESIRSIPYLEDSMSMMSPSHSHNHHHHHPHPHQGEQSPQQLGYTMERFLQERDATANSTRITTNITEVAAVAAAAAAGIASSTTNTDDTSDNNHDNMSNSNNNVIREETIEGDPNTAGAPDKGVVMERFLNDPVVVDAPPPPSSTALHEEDPRNRSEDVHRSVSFDMELRTAQYNNGTHNSHDNNHEDNQMANNNSPRNPLVDDHRNLSIDDSNASIRVEVSPEDDILTEPASPGRALSVPSEVAPRSSLDLNDHDHDDHRHHHRHLETDTSLLGSVGPSMDRQSTSSSNANHDNDDSTADEPRVFRLTEAEIQEMAAIEEASIGNAPPSDRDAESLVGDLVGEFGTPSAAGDGDVDPAGTTFSQGTPTTAMESGSILSGNQMMSALRSSSAMPGDPDRDEQDAHHNGDNLNLDGIDHQSIDGMAMEPSVSFHLVVSPGASVSGSAVSVAANPPSEIIERGGSSAALLLDDHDEDVDDHDDHDNNELAIPLPPPPVVVGSPAGPRRSLSPPSVVMADAHNDDHANVETDISEPITNMEMEGHQDHSVPSLLARTSPPPRPDCENAASIRAELASLGPPADAIVNRRMRPGMLNAQVDSPQSSPMRRIVSLPEKIYSGSSIGDTPKNNRTVDEFDFDKHDLPMTPRSLMSDSIRDLPGDDLWTSPVAKMTISPFHQRGAAKGHERQRDPKVDPLLMVPTMSRNPTASNSRAFPAQDLSSASPSPDLSKLDSVFRDVQMGSDSAVGAKEAEIYSRGSILSKSKECCSPYP